MFHIGILPMVSTEGDVREDIQHATRTGTDSFCTSSRDFSKKRRKERSGFFKPNLTL